MNASWDEPGPEVNNTIDFPTLMPVLHNNVNISKDVTIPIAEARAHISQASPVARSTTSSHNHHSSVTHIPSELADSKTRAPATLAPGSSTQVPHIPAWETIRPRAQANTTPVSSTAAAWESVLPRAPADATVAPFTPDLGGQAATREANAKATSAWNITGSIAPASAVLFPNAPPAIAPPTALLEKLSIANPDEPFFDEHHPDNPNFKVARYYNQFTQAFKCPHAKGTSCKKPLKTATAFIAHLRSAIHRDLEPQTCHLCHRPFPNATAYTQHVESQAVRCSARKTDNIGAWVEDFTQFATIDGLHDDDTNKYVNRSDGIVKPGDAVANIIEANRRAAEARAKAQETHWSREEIEKQAW